jgi:Rhodopirellula transposase DDE domain
MRLDVDVCDHVAGSFFAAMSPYLDEKLTRLCAGALASALGDGAVASVATAAGVSATTVRVGMRDLAEESAPRERVRRPGGGRPGIETEQPGIWEALDALIEPEERGDPENPLRWTVKSTRTLADELARQGFTIHHTTVAVLLREHGYSLRANAKVGEGKAAHGPDRDKQFRYINDTTRMFLAEGQPVISVDTKKKEPIGNFEQKGRTWRPYKDPVEVEDHTFAGDIDTIAVPYGVYDVGADEGFVNLGVSHDTPTFAVASIRRWWSEHGHKRYGQASRLLVVADSGGSNAARSLVFKALLHRFALETGLQITVMHLPPGTSKWNKVEHRLFAQISSTWRGRPLTSLETVIASISATSTRTGMSVTCVLDEADYPTGVTSSWDEIDRLPITFHDFRGSWNYAIAPTPAAPIGTKPTPPRHPGSPGRPQRTPITLIGDEAERAAWTIRWSMPDATGIRVREWKAMATRLETTYRELRKQQAEAARGRPSALPHREGRGLRIPIHILMLATVLHERHGLPVAQLSRLIDLHPVALGKHIAQLTPLFAQHSHPITATGREIKTLQQLQDAYPLPQDQPETR